MSICIQQCDSCEIWQRIAGDAEIIIAAVLTFAVCIYDRVLYIIK